MDAEPHRASVRVGCHPPSDVLWCFVEGEPSAATQVTVAEMSRSLLQQDRLGVPLVIRSLVQKWIGRPYQGLTAVKKGKVIFPGGGTAYRCLLYTSDAADE